MLSRGTAKGSITWIPTGGQTPPIATSGANEQLKKAQKKAKKKQISDTMNSNIPYFNPLCTTNVWCPWYVASLAISLHQIAATVAIKINEKRAR